MKSALKVLGAFTFLHICFSSPVRRPTNWLRQCRASTNISITALEVLPGGGWDNLRNLDMGRVMNLSYFQCQTTEDGLYFIPDEVFVIPQKETGLETNSEIISSWQEQKSTTSHSINSDVSFYSILNGKFSLESTRMKSHQVKDSSTTARVQVRNLIYTVKAYPDFTLDFRFTQQVKEIADAIENNQTRNADYLSEKMVLDYGTHVITSVDAGASLVKEDYLRLSYVSVNTSDNVNIKSQAAFKFFDDLKFDISSESSHQSSSQETYQYNNNVQYSLIKSHGGIPFYPGITLQKWQESTRNNLVAIDRFGFPLSNFINKNTFPDLPEPTVGKVARRVIKAIERYYKINTRPGCVDITSKNFNFQANIDDNSCEGPATNLSFGGVYQECTQLTREAGVLCDALAQKNIGTGNMSCRSPYNSTLLRSEIRQQGYSSYECHTERDDCFLFFNCDRQVCGNVYRVRSVRIDTYWCSVNGLAPEYSGYLFGGIYGPSFLNPITRSKTCPPNFIPVKFLSDGQIICLSNDYETGTRYSVPFGGLFSCQSGNPLAKNQNRCPPKFSQHLATVSDGCEILYCVQSGLFTGGELQPIRLPPFTKPPLVSMHVTNTVMVMTEGEKNWVRVGPTKAWRLVKPEEIQNLARTFNPGSNPGSNQPSSSLNTTKDTGT
ncbi:macrophage-expressed gene 1 protein-like [Cyprinodon tularosa]|uniref:macrophage-expressed gene 1 protein-like n=1 Tax=Cyprinodon tularosa TaxID=77115 RepID=UPI0018E26E52|nr:macrophage-expressed gene 1 protein-like [Cyprinodon tularosa]